MDDLHTCIEKRRERLVGALARSNRDLSNETIDHAARLWVAIVLRFPGFDTVTEETVVLSVLEAFCEKSPEDAELPEGLMQLQAKAAILYTIFQHQTFDTWRSRLA